MIFFFFSSRRRHTRLQGDWSSDVCSSDLPISGRSQRWASGVPDCGVAGLMASRLSTAPEDSVRRQVIPLRFGKLPRRDLPIGVLPAWGRLLKKKRDPFHGSWNGSSSLASSERSLHRGAAPPRASDLNQPFDLKRVKVEQDERATAIRSTPQPASPPDWHRSAPAGA